MGQDLSETSLRQTQELLRPRYSEDLAKALGMPDQFVKPIAYSAQMHDVKIDTYSFINPSQGRPS